MRALVTGITGFIGSHLAELLLGKGCTVQGTIFDEREGSNLAHVADRIDLINCDICDAEVMRDIVAAAQPDLVFHLAAHTGGRATQTSGDAAFRINVLGTTYLLEAIRTLSRHSLVLIPVSSAVFGVAENPQEPIAENTPYRPISLYGASKATQAMLACQYGLTYDLNIIRVHTFNCIGPRQSDRFACSAFARQIAEIEKGLEPPVLEVGDLDTYRDLTDVRDVVRAYWLAARRGKPGDVYNICSGQPYRIGAALDHLLGLSSHSIEIRHRPRYANPASIQFQVGDGRKFRERTGWRPAVSVEQSLTDTLEYWRARVPTPVSTPNA
jgi:GDP-4-dehydro-6-deoxy-D-mannose reductase